MKSLKILLVALLLLPYDAVPMSNGTDDPEPTGRRRFGLSAYISGIAVPSIESGCGGIGLNVDGFVSEFVNLNTALVMQMGGGFELGFKLYPLSYTPDRSWHFYFGNQFGIYSSGLFTVYHFRTYSIPFGIHYIGRKGLHFALDAGPGMAKVVRARTWGSSFPHDEGSHLALGIGFRLGYRFKSQNF